MNRLGRVLPTTPVRTAAWSVVGAISYVFVHLLNGGGFGAFVVAGSTYTDATRVAGGIRVLPGSGYDGQFFYRLAIDPFRLGVGEAYGIRFDNVFRAGRIGYPLLAWIVSLGGQVSLVPLALVIVNVVAIGVLGYAGARLAQLSGRAPAWGLLMAGYFGFAFSIARDLSEVVTAAAVVCALLSIRQQRYLVASAALTVAVLTREQSVLTVVVLAIGVLIAERRAGVVRAVRSAVMVSAQPAVLFVLWQVVASHTVGRWPALSSSDQHASVPFIHLPSAAWRWARQLFSHEYRRFAFILLVVLVVMVVAAIASGGLRTLWRNQPGEVLLGVYALLVTSGFYGLVDDPAYFRQGYELAIVCWLTLFAVGGRWLHRTAWLVLPVSAIAMISRALIV